MPIFRILVSWFRCNLAFRGLETPRMLAWRCQGTPTLLLERCSYCVSACCILVGERHLPHHPARCNWVGPRRTTFWGTSRLIVLWLGLRLSPLRDNQPWVFHPPLELPFPPLDFARPPLEVVLLVALPVECVPCFFVLLPLLQPPCFRYFCE